MDEFNLYFIGDIYVIIVVNNLLVVVIEIRIFYENIQKDGVFYKCLVFVKNGEWKFQFIMFCCLKKLGIEKIDFNEFIEEEICCFVCLDIDFEIIIWRCVFDVNDCYFCGVIVGMVFIERGQICDIGFDILVVSECMVILVLSISLGDMRECLGCMVVVIF